MSEPPLTSAPQDASGAPDALSAPANPAPAFSALLITAAWSAAALIGMRIAWDNGEARGIGLLFGLAASLPVIVWAALLWSGAPLHWTPRDSFSLFVLALLLRGILLPAEPAQSDDIYRYLWEGRVQRAGTNPFLHAPDSAELAHLRNADWTLINHPEYTAIYPPLAQAAFLLVAAVWPTVTAMKLFFTLCDLLTLAVLLRWLPRLGRSPAWAVLWAFHPLVIVEFSGNGHLDSLMVLLLVTAFWRLDEGRDAQAVLALTGAILAKLIPLLLLPFFFWKLRRRAWIALPLLLVPLAYLPWAGAGRGLVASLWIYQRDWLYNAPIFDFVRDALLATNGWHARYAFYAALALIAAGLWFSRSGPTAAALPLLGFYHVAGPVVHPWYLAVFVALLGARRGAWPWLWITVAAPLVYRGEAVPWVRALVWGPFLVGLLAQSGMTLLEGRRRRSA